MENTYIEQEQKVMDYIKIMFKFFNIIQFLNILSASKTSIALIYFYA